MEIILRNLCQKKKIATATYSITTEKRHHVTQAEEKSLVSFEFNTVKQKLDILQSTLSKGHSCKTDTSIRETGGVGLAKRCFSDILLYLNSL